MVQGGNYSPLFEVGGKAFLGGNFKLSHHRFLTRFFSTAKIKYMLYMCHWCARVRVRATRTHLKWCTVRSNTVRRNFTPNNNGYRNQNLYKLDLLFSFDFLLPIKIKFMSPILAFLTCKNIFS